MIVLDTNVTSELMRPRPDPNVRAWVGQAGRLHTTAITLAETEYGIARMPAGDRRDHLTLMAARLFADFASVILPFDASAARRYAEIAADRERAGRPVATPDAQIAAICASRGATLATRNIRDFTGTGISLINPWDD